MDFCILGMLMYSPLSLYDLKLAFQSSLSLFYSASLGSMQVTLAKLLGQGLIEIASESATGRRKRTYRITAAGRARFFEAMLQEIPMSRIEETALARYFFLGLVESKEVRIQILELLIRTAEQALASLEAGRIEYRQAEIPDGFKKQAAYQLATLDYGIMAHGNGVAWFKERLAEERGS
jgi:DNA-binding PadR family transcriptional regulator